MSLAQILGRFRGPVIGGVQVDASISEVHRTRNEVTDNPVELGSDVQDHSRRMPNEYALDGVLADAPTTPSGFARLQASGESSSKRYSDLLDLVENADTFDVLTGIRMYRDMVFLSFEVRRDKTTGGIIGFRAEMKQISFAFGERVPVVSSEADAPKVSSVVNEGPKKTTPAPEGAAEGMRSSASRIFTKANSGSLASFLGGL